MLDRIKDRTSRKIQVSAVDAEDRDEALESIIRWLGLPNISVLQDPHCIQGPDGTIYQVHVEDDQKDVPTDRRLARRLFVRYFNSYTEVLRAAAPTEQDRNELIEQTFEIAKQI